MEVKDVSVDRFQQFKFITIINKPVKFFLDNASIIFFFFWGHIRRCSEVIPDFASTNY